MKNMMILLLAFLCACSKTEKPIEDSTIKLHKLQVISDYYNAYKYIFHAFIDKIEFPPILCQILSQELLAKEMEWYENTYVLSVIQMIDQKTYYLGNISIELIEEAENCIYVFVNTLRNNYVYDKSELDIVKKIKNKLNDMRNNGFVIGKGWYPVSKTKEMHIFYFNNANQIDKIESYILSGKLNDTYEGVIKAFIETNNDLNKK